MIRFCVDGKGIIMDMYTRLRLKHIQLFMRSVSCKIGSMHSWWEYISDITMMLEEGHCRLGNAEDLILTCTESINASKRASDYEEFSKIPYLEKPFIDYLFNGLGVPELYQDEGYVDYVGDGKYKWKEYSIKHMDEALLNSLLRMVLTGR